MRLDKLLWRKNHNKCCNRAEPLPPRCDAFNASPAAEFRMLGHRIGQLPPPAGGVVQHLRQPAQDFFIQSADAHFPLLHLRSRLPSQTPGAAG